MRGLLFAVALTAPLGACVSLLPKAPPAPLVYPLDAAPPGAEQTSAVKQAVIAVGEPAVPRTLSGADIVWVRDGKLASIEGAAWDGRTPGLLQRLLMLTIDRVGLVQGAVRTGDGRADAELGWDVLQFGVVEDGALEARLAAHVDLFGRGRRLIGALEVSETAPLGDRSSSAAAAALQQAARAASAKIAAWAAQNTVPSAEETAPPPWRAPQRRSRR